MTCRYAERVDVINTDQHGPRGVKSRGVVYDVVVCFFEVVG
jgi:hypothetical protein